MKKIVLMTAMSLVMMMILDVQKGISEDPEAIRALRGYALKNPTGPRSDFNIWVVTNEHAFNEEFIAGEGASLRPDFNHQMVLAIHAETMNYIYHPVFVKSEVRNNELHVYFTVRKAGPDAVSGQVSLATVDKTPGIQKVHFYHDKIRIRTIPIVSVY